MEEIITAENRDRFLEESGEKIGCEIKQYFNAQKSIVKTAEAEIRKATSFEEKKYWMDIMLQTKKEERQDVIIMVLSTAGVIIAISAIALFKRR